jgi:hypothetical protein
VRGALVTLALAVMNGTTAPAEQVTRIADSHYGAPCPAPTAEDPWCESDEAVMGQQLWVPGGATRVVRVEVPEGKTITRIQLSMTSRWTYLRCSTFDLRRNHPLTPSECRPVDPTVTAGRGRFASPRLNGNIVTVSFTNLEPYIQQPYLRVYYRK